ncbi:DMT family transporter [Thioclava nitratireducens]|uniref:DMT family transporter n=1 Tax=Thioclava nitratireducens TaxID=1915078 RepID=UPI0024818950|nr:DMT family transporter [Thioclava nitratireducens]WGT52624.1 DMT family transporter [Thioclava nitratireducens]
MTALIGGLLATLGAFCYALSSVAIVKSARSAEGRGNDVLVSVLMTAAMSGGLWLIIGPPLPGADLAMLTGVSYFVCAGILGNVLGRLTLFRSVELNGAIETGLIRRLIPVFAAVLAVLLLGEVITPVTVVAFLLVTAGVLIMMMRSFGRSGLLSAFSHSGNPDQGKGRALALGSAASYGGSFVARKLAMQTMPDPLLGAFIGALTGLGWFGASALRAGRPRAGLAGMRMPSLWQLLAAGSMSIGQIVVFFALQLADVATVAIIASVEMFFAAWLAGHIFKTEKPPGRRFYIASVLAGAGVVLLAVSPMLR